MVFQVQRGHGVEKQAGGGGAFERVNVHAATVPWSTDNSEPCRDPPGCEWSLNDPPASRHPALLRIVQPFAASPWLGGKDNQPTEPVAARGNHRGRRTAMGYRLPVTIAETLKRIQTHDLVLPAIQREFVWEDRQIEALFDSLLRGYPIGSFLSWTVEADTAKQFKFYDFMLHYHQWTNPHCQVLDLATDKPIQAILDGQQRLTSLNIGLRGSYATRKSGAWRFKASSYPVRRLYLNVFKDTDENDEDGRLYDFRMLTDAQRDADSENPDVHWFPVHLCYDLALDDLMGEIAERGVGNTKAATKMLIRLYTAIHNEPTLYFYEETDQDVERVLDIFVRVNSGGEPLSYSDLLLSIATAQWDQRDARAEIHKLVDTLNGTGAGFSIKKDAILKAGLVLAGVSDVGFKVKNFNAANMAKLQNEWDDITAALTTAVNLLADFGLSDATLSADSVLIPVAYYVRRRGLTDAYRAAPKHANDRAILRSWVMRSLIKPGIWGSGLDSLLRDLRNDIDSDGADGFPIKKIEASMASRAKSLTFGEEEIADILALKYGRNRTFAVLAILFPHVNTRNQHHIDHVFPQTLLRANKLKPLGFNSEQIREMQDQRDRLPNLQLLEGPENIAKSGTDPATWVAENYTAEQQSAHLERHALPWLPSSAKEFDAFYEDRKEALAERIRKHLGTPTATSPEPGQHSAVEAAQIPVVAD